MPGAHPGGAKLAHLAEHLGRGAGQAVGTGAATSVVTLAAGASSAAASCERQSPPRRPRDGGERVHQPRHRIAATAVDVPAGESAGIGNPCPSRRPAIGYQQILLGQGAGEDLGPLDQAVNMGYLLLT